LHKLLTLKGAHQTADVVHDALYRTEVDAILAEASGGG